MLGGAALGAAAAAARTSTAALGLFSSTALAVLVVLAVRDRRRRAGRALRVPLDPASSLAAVLLGAAAYVVVGTALAGTPPPTGVLVVWFVLAGGVQAFWPRWRRRDEAVVRSARPTGVLVRGAVDADASLPLARWAEAADVPLPVLLTLDLLLVGLPEGLELWVSPRRGRPPERVTIVAWDDVELRRATAPQPQLGWGAVLVLHGAAAPGCARAVPRARTVHEVPLRLYAGAQPAVRAETVDALVAQLLAPSRPRPVDAVGDVG